MPTKKTEEEKLVEAVHSASSGESDAAEQSDTVEAASRRRMPPAIRAHLIKLQGGRLYLQVPFRVVWFRDELGDDWAIRTTIVEGGHAAEFATVKAEIVNPAGVAVATGHKSETKKNFPAGWTEKAETGAVGRALSLQGFGTQFDPELEEGTTEAGVRVCDAPLQPKPQAPKPAAVDPILASGRKRCLTLLDARLEKVGRPIDDDNRRTLIHVFIKVNKNLMELNREELVALFKCLKNNVGLEGPPNKQEDSDES